MKNHVSGNCISWNYVSRGTPLIQQLIQTSSYAGFKVQTHRHPLEIQVVAPWTNWPYCRTLLFFSCIQCTATDRCSFGQAFSLLDPAVNTVLSPLLQTRCSFSTHCLPRRCSVCHAAPACISQQPIVAALIICIIWKTETETSTLGQGN